MYQQFCVIFLSFVLILRQSTNSVYVFLNCSWVIIQTAVLGYMLLLTVIPSCWHQLLLRAWRLLRMVIFLVGSPDPQSTETLSLVRGGGSWRDHCSMALHMAPEHFVGCFYVLTPLTAACYYQMLRLVFRCEAL